MHFVEEKTFPSVGKLLLLKQRLRVDGVPSWSKSHSLAFGGGARTPWLPASIPYHPARGFWDWGALLALHCRDRGAVVLQRWVGLVLGTWPDAARRESHGVVWDGEEGYGAWLFMRWPVSVPRLPQTGFLFSGALSVSCLQMGADAGVPS